MMMDSLLQWEWRRTRPSSSASTESSELSKEGRKPNPPPLTPSEGDDDYNLSRNSNNNMYSRRRGRRKQPHQNQNTDGGGGRGLREYRCRKSLGSRKLNSALASSSPSVSSSLTSPILVVNVILIVLVSWVGYANCSSSVESSLSLSAEDTLNHRDDKGEPSIYSNHFAVHVPTGEERANEIAGRHGFVNTGQIGSLKNYYLFEHARIRKRSVEQSDEHHQLLSDEPDVSWFEQQVEKRRVKRDFQYYDGGHGPSGSGPSAGGFFGSPSTHSYIPSYGGGNGGFQDPLWKEQWYLTGGSKDGFDMNVQAAWKRGFTGKGVTVSILDDGIQTNHPDLILNYDPRASTDINDNDNDPYPQDNGDNKHGTRCAGEVAATAGNNICGVGVAYNASIGGVRMLDGTVNDAVEAKALGLNPDHVDIFSASWGPEDDGKTVDGPGPLARRAFIYGVTNGRRGLGSIFIWASGNGGRHVDSCNCDGYTNSIFTLSISSATQGGYKPWYLEECSSTLATTYSSGTPTLDKSVATVDMDGRLRPDHICTVEHTGTSASAPLAAGIAALALEANPNLSWRDLQHLVVLTSRPDPLEKEEGWYVNGVQRKFSHKFGYGLMDAGKMVELAVDWAGVPPQHICKSREIREDREIPGSHLGKVKVFMDVDGCAGTNSEIRNLEHVQCKISLRFFPRGNLRILLTSPMGTTSVLLFERPRDVSSSNFDDWPFLSVHFWGEQAHGRWTLEIINSGSRRINQPGMLKRWQLILYGTDVNPIRLKSRSIQLSQPHPSAAGQYDPTGQQSHASYRAVHGDGSQTPPRFVPQEYLFGSGSENHEQVASAPAPAVLQQEYIYTDQNHDQNVSANSPVLQRESPISRTQSRPYSNGTCADGYFYNANGRDCRECHPSCARCTGPMALQCRSCSYPLRLDRGSSRCIPCCQRADSEDCCHCDDKRHAGHSSLSPSPYTGECHFVSRRVSESEESQLSAGGLSDKVVLMSFWFTAFILVLAVGVIFQRRKQGKRDNANSSSNSRGSESSTALLVNSNSRNVKYTPVNLSDDLDLGDNFREDQGEDGHLNGNSNMSGDEDDVEEEIDFQDGPTTHQSEGVPLILKT